MVIDTSAVLAILQDEPERASFNQALEDADARLMSAATLVEASIVLESRWGADGLRDFDLLLECAGIEIIPVDAVQARSAHRAWSRFGTGRHPAALNYGDCFSYALAVTSCQPLLFKGDDFGKTDVGVVTLLPTRSTLSSPTED